MIKGQEFIECSVLSCNENSVKFVLLYGTNFGQPVCKKHLDYYVEHSMVNGAVDCSRKVEEICGECGMAEANKDSGLCSVCQEALIEEHVAPSEVVAPVLLNNDRLEPAFR